MLSITAEDCSRPDGLKGRRGGEERGRTERRGGVERVGERRGGVERVGERRGEEEREGEG